MSPPCAGFHVLQFSYRKRLTPSYRIRYIELMRTTPRCPGAEMSRAVTQRAAAERYAQSKGHTPNAPGFWALVAGVLAGYLAQRDAEQAAEQAPPVAEDEARVPVEHQGVPYLVDYEFDEDARCAEVTHIWCGPHDLLPGYGEELAAAPSFAERAAEADLKRCAGVIRRNGSWLETAMACGVTS